MDVLSDTYWTTEFAVTEADLNRLAHFIDAGGQALHLSALAKRIISGRLRHGPEQSMPVHQLFGASSQVRLWDPAAEWQEGDQIITLRKPDGRFVVYIGEVQAVHLDRSQIIVFLPEENLPIPYKTMSPDDPRRRQIKDNLQREIARKREQIAGRDSDESHEELVEITMMEHGERVASLLLYGLQSDDRFILLDGRWYLRRLAAAFQETQLQHLAWTLLADPDPQPTAALLARISPGDSPGNTLGDQEDAALFGLYEALRQHPQWFKNTQPGQRPLWTLAGPPPGSFTPQYAAYDPHTYEILCLPKTDAPPEIVARLWEVGLLKVVAMNEFAA